MSAEKWTYEFQDTADEGPSYVIRNEAGEWIADAYHEDVARTICDRADARAQGVREGIERAASLLDERAGATSFESKMRVLHEVARQVRVLAEMEEG